MAASEATKTFKEGTAPCVAKEIREEVQNGKDRAVTAGEHSTGDSIISGEGCLQRGNGGMNEM